MNRDATLTWLQTVFRDLLDLGGIDATDTPDGLGFVLDQVEAIYQARPTLSPAYVNDLASWFLLSRLNASMLSVAAKVTVDGDTFDVSRTLDGIESWLNRLRARIGWIVEPVEEVQSDVGKVVTVFQPYTAGSMLEGDEW